MMKPSIYHLLNQKQEMCILSDVKVERKLNTSRYNVLFQIKWPPCCDKIVGIKKKQIPITKDNFIMLDFQSSEILNYPPNFLDICDPTI